MTVLPEVVQELPVESVSIARLHGEACITCGSTKAPLTGAGHVYTASCSGGRLGWAVVACPEHQAVASC